MGATSWQHVAVTEFSGVSGEKQHHNYPKPTMKSASHQTARSAGPHLVRIAALLLASAAMILGSHPSVRGQEDPFGSSPSAGSKPAAKTTPSSSGATEEAANEDSEFQKKVAAETDPLVRTILKVKPTTPEQWMHDVQFLLNLRRPEFAKEYLKQFLAAKPDDATLAKLESRFGSAFFLKLATMKSLQPEGAEASQTVMRAASEQLKNAQRLTALVDRLNNPDKATRRMALVELVKAGPDAVPAMIAVLGDASRAADHDAVKKAIVALGKEAIDPLIATLRAPDNALVVQVIEILAALDARSAVPYLLGAALAGDAEHGGGPPKEAASNVSAAARKMITKVLGDLPSRDAALEFLTRRMDNYLAGNVTGVVDPMNQVTLWVWDANRNRPVQQTMAADDASFLAAARLAQERYRIDPQRSDLHQMYLATGLEVAKRRNGYDRPLTEQDGSIVQEASAANTSVLQDVLLLALKRNMPGAAVAAINLLGSTGNSELLTSDDGKPRLLAQSLVSPLRRVQFAAAQAIMQIDPTQPFPGCSYLPRVLGYLAASGGRRRVLIGDPRVATAQTWAGFYQGLGFEAETEQTGRSLILQAFESPDYCLLLIGDAIDHPRYRDIVETLRQDPRTADLPIGLVIRDVNEATATMFARTDPLTVTMAPPQTQQDVEADAHRLLELAGRGQLSEQERMREADIALDALAKLASDSDRYGFYELLKFDERLLQVLETPALAAKAVRVLGLLGTPLTQRALVEFASSPLHPISDRQAAAAALRVAIQRRGLLLTRPMILHQYDLYNRSEALGRDTQQVLASVLDAIEEPTQKPDSRPQDK